jgi:putative aminopeptidase FrvX
MMDIDLDYVKSLMAELLAIPSCGGYSREAMERVRREFEALGVGTVATKKGALIGTLAGRDDETHKMISAHIDTLGAMVKEIKPNGRLKLTNIGGFAWQAFEAENAVVKTMDGREYSGALLPEKASVHIFSDEAREGPRTEETMELRIDENTKTREETERLGVAVGDFVFFDPKTRFTKSGYVKSRFLDDKACVAVLFGAIKHFRDSGAIPDHTTHFYVSNYEEIGHGISLLPEKVDELVALDIGTVGGSHTSDERCVTIVAKDSRTPYDFELRKKLVDIAKANGIDYRVDVHYRYGSDASMAVLQGFEANFACIGMGVDATHHYERTHMDGIANNLKLLIKYLAE